MDKTGSPWIFPIVLVAFTLTGIISAIRGNYILSGVFALYFIGYFVIRGRDRLRIPKWRIPESVWRAGFVLIFAGYSFYLIYLVFRRL